MWGREKKKQNEKKQDDFDAFDAFDGYGEGFDLDTEVSVDSMMLDVGSLGLIDESVLTLTESDLQDAELLSAFSRLGAEDEPMTEPVIESPDIEDEKRLQENSAIDLMEEFDTHENKTTKQTARSSSLSQVDTTITQKNTAKSEVPSAMTALDQRLLSLSKPKMPDSAEEIKSLKQKALALKSAGNMEEAIKVLRKAKELESTSKTSPPKAEIESPANTQNTKKKHPKTAKSAPSPRGHPAHSAPPVVDQFTPLEHAVTEAMNEKLELAKSLKDKSPAEAATHFRRYKSLKEELNVIASRRHFPSSVPPMFSWESTSTRVKVENTSLAEDQIRVVVEGANDLESVLGEHKSRSISISYSTGIVKDPPTTETVTSQYSDSSRSVQFNSSNIYTFRRRGPVESLFSRKKATFELILHRGFFKADVSLATARLPLEGLLRKGRIGGDLSLTDSNGRKKLGGTLRVYISLRNPISTEEFREEVTRELRIGEWPTAVPANPPPSATHPPAAAPLEITRENSAPSSDIASEVVAPAPSTAPPFSSSLSELEREDPHHVNLLVSNDVLEAEIETANLGLARSRSDEEKQDISIRLMLLTSRLSVLVSQVQDGEISLPQYIDNLKERITQDKLLAVYLSKTDRKKDALSVMKRIRIMESEVAGAANVPDSSDDEDGDST